MSIALFAEGVVVVKSGNRLEAIFSEKGVLLDMRKDGIGMLDNRADGPAWTLTYKGGEFTSRQYATPPFVSYGGGETTFRWEQEGLPAVVASIRPLPEQDGFAFTCGVENETTVRLDDLRFPNEFRLKTRSDQDYLLVCKNTGLESLLTPLRTMKDFEVMYPGYMEMQFSGFRIGDDALLFYTDDTEAYVKSHSFSAKDDILAYAISEYIALAPGDFWDPIYSVVLRIIPSGDYNDMAHKYGEWARQQPWARKKIADKLAERPSLDRILTDGLCRFDSYPAGQSHRQTADDAPWDYIDDPEQNPFVKLEPYYEEDLMMFARHERLYGINPGWWLPIWSGRRFDAHFPEYFPVEKHMGDFEKFKAECIRQGFTFLPHMNTVQWAIFNMPEEVRPRYMATQDGSPYMNWKYANIRQVITNLARSFERERPTVQRISSKSDHAGIYLDCLAHGFAKDNSPGNPYGHYANGYQQAKIHQMRSIRKIIAGPVMAEGRTETLLPYMDLATGANGNSPNTLPIWEMVYGDCLVNNTFNSHYSPYFRKLWIVQGGLISSYWPKWGEDKGQDLDIYTETACQRVIRHVEGTLLRRHDRPKSIAISQWDDGVVFWNPPATRKSQDYGRVYGPAVKKDDVPAENLDFTTQTHGRFTIEGIARDGVWAWMAGGDFIADHVRKVSLNGEVLFTCDSDDLVVIRGLGRWVIRNCSAESVKVTIYSKCLEENPLPCGKWVRQQREETPECIGGTVTLEIPGDELFVSGIPLE
ncbi:MAG: hypothetical protein J5654_08805 [Victivallales bacterium]|nr:hypothetical protein [Victivallales bacterium]